MNKLTVAGRNRRFCAKLYDGSAVRDIGDDMNRAIKDKLYNDALINHKVWKGADGRYRFKWKGKLIAKTKEEDIKTVFFQYVLNENRQDMTFKDLFKEWIAYKEECSGISKGKLSPSTIKRYHNDYQRFIKDTAFEKKKLSEITAVDIERFLKKAVESKSIGVKCLNNLFGYVSQAFFYANKSEITERNPSFLVDKSRITGFCVEKTKEDKDRVLSDTEVAALIKAVRIAIEKDPLYLPNFAILLALNTGMRIGEIAALKWECIHDGYIHIDYSEHRYDYKDKPSVIAIGEPKNGKHRVFPLTPEIQALFDEIKDIQTSHGINATFVFQSKKKRFTALQIGLCMRRRCKGAKIPEKCIHDIRRTVSSKLRAVLPSATVAALMGHTEETNNNNYNYDVTDLIVKKEVLSSMWKSSKPLKNKASLKSVTGCNPGRKTKKKTRNPVIIRFPA